MKKAIVRAGMPFRSREAVWLAVATLLGAVARPHSEAVSMAKASGAGRALSAHVGEHLWHATCFGTRFSPVIELRAATERAAARWSAATGCRLTVGEGGIPVSLVDEVLTPAGERANGATDLLRDGAGQVVGCIGLRIGRSTADPERTLLHEFGHALGATLHAKGGLMARAPVVGASLDRAAIDLVCQHLDCALRHSEG
jgi:hypothetical protein